MRTWPMSKGLVVKDDEKYSSLVAAKKAIDSMAAE